jgi:energy-coupling factor transporter ATP-binding protein EcfA2
VAFLRADFDYGCHVGSAFEIPQKEAPVVIAGPNGSGKTTLVEALVRTLFGFDRRQPAERDCLASRVPWAGEHCRAAIEIQGGDGRGWRIFREFDEGRVEVEALDGSETWSGDGNPAAGNQEAQEYRRRLAWIFGLSEIEHYESTACITQGRLLDTRLREELLQIEGGGYGNVEDARKRIADAHGLLTSRPIEGSGRSKTKPRQLETADAELAGLRSRIKSADAVLSWRAPLEKEVDELRTRGRGLDAEIVRLERALGPLNGRRALEARIEARRARQATIEKSRHRLDRAIRQLRGIEEAVAVPFEERYPPDFLERVGRLEWMWARQATLRGDRDRLEAEPRVADVPRPWIAPALAALLAAAGAVGSVIAGSALPAIIGGALAVVVGTALALHRANRGRRRDETLHKKRVVYDELDRLAQDLSRALEGIPRARTLSPATVEERRHAFGAQRQAAEKVGAAREALEEELRDASRTLAGGTSGAQPAVASGTLADRAAELLSRCAEAGEGVRTDIARAQIEIEGLAAFDLPEGIDPAPESVETALAERRAERRAIEEQARTAETRLVQEGTGHESPVALRDELETREAVRAAIDREARVHEAAFALIRDAYQDFREHDRDRLLGAVSRSLLDLTGGAIGPVEAPGSLADAGVRLHGRQVELRSPPLSYGEFHAALIGIRLGASDFHARSGIRPPMIVDEPFAYLDLDRARELWRLLCRVAQERQVFVVTQEALTLEALGIAPDIELVSLTRSSPPADTSPSAPGP